jgi:CRP-like cAMP-binding protein
MKQGSSAAAPTPILPRASAAPAAAGAVRKIWRDDPLIARIGGLIDLDAADLRNLRAVIETEVTVAKRRDLVLDGYEFCKLCFVKAGFAARYKLLRNGKRQIVNFVLPGDIVGLPGSFLSRAAMSVVAVSNMTLQICSLQAFIDLCYRQPKFGLLLGWLGAQEAANCAEHTVNVGRRAPTERLAHLLLEIHARLAPVGLAGDTTFTLPFTQEMMSDALGLSVPHLNRTLGRLRADGLIALVERQVEFIDRKRLEMLAQFQPMEPARIPTPGAMAVN